MKPTILSSHPHRLLVRLRTPGLQKLSVQELAAECVRLGKEFEKAIRQDADVLHLDQLQSKIETVRNELHVKRRLNMLPHSS